MNSRVESKSKKYRIRPKVIHYFFQSDLKVQLEKTIDEKKELEQMLDR